MIGRPRMHDCVNATNSITVHQTHRESKHALKYKNIK